jgi:hypothetical protein
MPAPGIRVDANRVAALLKIQLSEAHMQNAVLTVALEDANMQIESLRAAIQEAHEKESQDTTE